MRDEYGSGYTRNGTIRGRQNTSNPQLSCWSTFAADFWLAEVPWAVVVRRQPWSKLSSFRSRRIHPPVRSGVLRFPWSGSRRYCQCTVFICECHHCSTNGMGSDRLCFLSFLRRSISSSSPSARPSVQSTNILCHCILFRSATTSDTSPTVHTDSRCVVSLVAPRTSSSRSVDNKNTDVAGSARVSTTCTVSPIDDSRRRKQVSDACFFHCFLCGDVCILLPS